MITKELLRMTVALSLIIILLFAGFPVYAAAEWELEWSEDAGADIHWYDFNKKYENYRIQRIHQGSDFYQIEMTTGGDHGGHAVGIVDGKGNVVIEPDAYDISSVSYYPDDFSMSVLRKGDVCYLISGGRITQTDVSAYEEIGPFFNGYATVTLKASAQRGVIDSNGHLLFSSDIYKRFQHAGDGVFSASTGAEQNLSAAGYLLDASGVPLSQYYYDYIDIAYEGMIRVSRNEKWGFVDLSGREVIPAIYDRVGFYQANVAPMQKGGKWGLIDQTGEEIITPVFDQIYPLVGTTYCVLLSDKVGVIDNAGNTILPVEYDGVSQAGDGRSMAALKGDTAYLFDMDGVVILSGEYLNIFINPDGTVAVAKRMNDMTVNAFLDKEGNNLTGYKDFSLSYLNQNLSLGRRYDSPPGMIGATPHDYGQQFALIDAEGNNLTGFNYENTGDFTSDYLVVNRSYYGSAGLLNRYGAEVLPTVFDDILLTADGYAFLQTRGSEDGFGTRVGIVEIPDYFSDAKRIPPITVYVDGLELYFDSEPLITNSRTMVPMRKIFEVLGADVSWDEDEKKVTAVRDGVTVELTIEKGFAFIDGERTTLDAPALLQNDRTLVPLRFISESLDCYVDWDNSLRRVIIVNR